MILDDATSNEMHDDGVERPVKRVKYGMSEIHNLGGKGSNMAIT